MSSCSSSSNSAFLPYNHLAIHASVSTSIALLSFLLSFPSHFLYGLHTYIHPENLGASDGLRAAIRRPSTDPSSDADLKKRPRSKAPEFDEANAQLFRLRLVDSHLRTRLYFPEYRTSFVSSIFTLASLLTLLLFPGGYLIPFLSSLFTALYLFYSLTKLSLERSATKRSEKQLSGLVGFIGFVAASAIVSAFSPSTFDFRFGTGSNADAGLQKTALAITAGSLSGLLLVPASRAARGLWIGTDQLRWNLGVVSCGSFGKALLYISYLMNVFTALLWINPLAEWPARVLGSENLPLFRVWCLAISAALQVLALRSNLQMYLNEAVLSWYQRLHASKVPDMDFGRAKIFLHNYYLCLVALQLFAPPILMLIFLGISQLKGNLLSGFIFAGNLADGSSLLKEMCLFLAWWIMLVWAVFTTSTLALFRCGYLFIS